MTANWRSGLPIAFVSGGVTSLFIINLCNAIYRCGCRWLWAGGSAHCNIHVAHTKHCPWCSIGTGGFGLLLASILIPQIVLSFWPETWPWRARFGAALLAFPAMGTVAALIVGWWTGYWA